MNKVLLTGNITKDTELKTTEKGTSYCQFTLALNGRKNADGERRVDFIDCVAWGKTAELIAKYTQKGNKLGVIGELQKDDYTAQDGTKRYVTKVNVQEVEFLSSKQKEQEKQSKTANYNDFFGAIDDDDMPF